MSAVDAAPIAMRAGITIGDVNGKMASTRAEVAAGGALREHVRADEQHGQRGEHRARLLLTLDERAQRARGGEVEHETEDHPRQPTEDRGAEAGREIAPRDRLDENREPRGREARRAPPSRRR